MKNVNMLKLMKGKHPFKKFIIVVTLSEALNIVPSENINFRVRN